jgi:ribosomal-protein-alanine N-acetyltransferase
MALPVNLPGGAVLRAFEPGDAPALLDSYLRNREHLRRYDPVRPDAFYTLAGQQRRLDSILQQQQAGTLLGTAMLRDGEVLGTAMLNTIVRGAACTASLGYWVAADALRQGLASATVAALCKLSDQELDLHRLSASTHPTNVASQRVLAKNGFEKFGFAPRYLHINGAWSDAILFQRILNDRPAALPRC